MAHKLSTTGTSGWVGWVYFASALLLVAGGFQIIAGLVGIFNSDYYVVTQSGLLALDFTTWGWIHLLLGTGLVAAGIGLFNGSTWARVVAIVVTVLAMIDNLAFMSAYPLWSIAALVINVLVLYAVTMHGAELKEQ